MVPEQTPPCGQVTQALPQQVWPVAQSPSAAHCTQVPPEQTGALPEQALPQVPQLFLSLLRSVHLPPQQPGVVPLVQTMPQPPQLFLSVCSFTQVPLQQFSPEVLQSPALPQVQAPLTHVSPEAHMWPHPPQLCGLVFVLTQVPLQLVVPAGHMHIPLMQSIPGGH